MVKIILIVLEFFLVIVFIIVVFLQFGKSVGFFGLIVGGVEIFFGKYKGRIFDVMFGRYIWIIAAVFFVVLIVLFFVIK